MVKQLKKNIRKKRNSKGFKADGVEARKINASLATTHGRIFQNNG